MKTDAERLKDLTDRFTEKRYGNLKHLLLVVSTLLGILVCFQPSNSQPYIARLMFECSVASLSLGCVALVVAIYGELDTYRTARMALGKEIKRAREQGEKAKCVGVPVKKLFLAAEACAYGCVSISFLLLSLYVFLK